MGSAAAAQPEIDRLAWLAGCWRGESAEPGSGEQWMPAAGGTMLGMSRTVTRGATEFEFMELRYLPDGKLVFIAHPAGRQTTVFPLLRISDSEAVFENPEHDFPQRIAYAREGGSKLRARIDGVGNGALRVVEFLMTRVSCDRSSTTAQGPPLTALDEFSLDGLDVGVPVMNQSMDIVLQKFGLPQRIEIGRANWDVDREETPAQWVYPGFTVTTLYLRDGEVVPGANFLVPGPYRESGLVVGVRVFGESVRVRFGLAVGVDVQQVVDRLGPPPRYRPSDIGLEYRSYSEGESTRTGVEVKFLLDGPGGKVREIVWEREPWH
jgi:hypothetical protein